MSLPIGRERYKSTTIAFEKFSLSSKQIHMPVTVKSELKRLCKLPTYKWIVEAWRRDQSRMDVRRRKLGRKYDKSVAGKQKKYILYK